LRWGAPHYLDSSSIGPSYMGQAATNILQHSDIL